MFTAGPDGAGLPVAAGDDGPGAGADVAGCAVGPGAAWAGADGRGHRRKAPSPARTSTMTAKATLRCADVRSIGRRYFRRRSGRSQNGPRGGSVSGPRSPPERATAPPLPQLAGAPGPGARAGGWASPAACRGGAPPDAARGPLSGQRGWAGPVPPRAQPAAGGGPADVSRDGRSSGGGVRPAPLPLVPPSPAPRGRPPRPAAPARAPEPPRGVSCGSSPSRPPAPLPLWPFALGPSGAAAEAPAIPPAAAAAPTAPAPAAVAATPAARPAACAGLRRAHRAAR